jgi:hypothetical protein
MADLVLRPRSATELVDAAFQVYRRAPLQFMLGVAAVYVPWLVIRLVFDFNITPPATANATLSIDMNQLVAMAAVGMAIFALAGGVTTVLASNVYLDRSVDVAAAFSAVFRRFVSLVAASLLVVILIVLGAMFFLFPALYVVARFYAVRQAVMLEDAGVGRALARASELSKGFKWHILATLFFIAVLTIAVDFGVSMLLEHLPSRVLVNLISTALAVVIGPLFGITETVLYYDLRIRREGFDVEYLAGAAAPASPQPSDATA